MGIDFLDVSLRIEKRFGFRMRQEDWESVPVHDRHHPDITVGDLFDFIASKHICRKCEYDLRGHPDTGICPECGSEFDFTERGSPSEWEAVRRLLSDAMDTNLDRITRDTRLIRDLGMT